MTTTRFWILVVAGLCAGAPAVWAGGFSSARFGAEQGHPASDHPTSIYFNPAGLALSSGTRVYGEGLFVWRMIDYNRPEEAIDNVVEPGEVAAGTPREAVSANAGDAELRNFLVSPFFGVTTDAGVEGLGLGLAVYAPFGGQADWERNPEYEGSEAYPGAVDGVQRWSTITGTIRSLYVTAAGAYRLPGPRLSFGVGVNVVLSSVETVRARVANGTDHLVGEDGSVLEGRSLVDASGTQLALGGGVTWEALPDALWIGASYQSIPGFGEMSLSGTLTNKFGAGAASETAINFEQTLPDIYRLGARYRVTPEIELRLSGDFQRWSVLEDQCLVNRSDSGASCEIAEDGTEAPGASGVIVNVKRDWNDTFGVRAGGSYHPNSRLEVGGSVAYDSNAVPDETVDPALLDMDKLLITGSARYRLLDSSLELALAYTQVVYFDRTVAPEDVTVFPQPSRTPSGAGSYEQLLGLFTLGVQYSF